MRGTKMCATRKISLFVLGYNCPKRDRKESVPVTFGSNFNSQCDKIEEESKVEVKR